jgi:asparagine synthase (glutamine-hydrolysing)
MCGINGILFRTSSEARKPNSYFHDIIDRMNTAVRHRGPDGEGSVIQYPLCLGHRRLSILDLSDHGAQPMFTADRTAVIVFNGEIYNYVEIADDLKAKGYTFTSHSDTEVILYAYKEYGFDCVKRFNGMWAFALYDFKKKLLFASRDRCGVKPFFYHLDEQAFAFSSEIKGLLQFTSATNANLGKVYDYLAYGYRNNNADTFFQGIYELKPAHNLLIQHNQVQHQRYWDFDSTGPLDQGHRSYEASQEEFLALFRDAVRIRFRSDVPVAILLSGGVDSTAITCMVDEFIERRELDYDQVRAFSASFPGFALDEGERVREFVKSCKHVQLTEHLPSSQGLQANIQQLIYGLGEPVFSTTAFAHQDLMRGIRNAGIKVVLNGQGSDEAFCGYGRYILGYFLLDTLFSRPGTLFRQARAIKERMAFSYSYMLSQVFKSLISRRQASYLRGKYQEHVVDCLDPHFVRENYGYFWEEAMPLFSQDGLTAYLKANIRDHSFGQILHYEDHSSMQQSVEIRSPFIDYRLMEFAFSLPTAYKFDLGVTKRIIRDSLKDYLPSAIRDNHRKIGFATPIVSWLKDPAFRDFVFDLLHSESFRGKHIWNHSAIEARFTQPDRFPQFPFWRVLNLELWSRYYGITSL